jgi:hypothetical protein
VPSWFVVRRRRADGLVAASLGCGCVCVRRGGSWENLHRPRVLVADDGDGGEDHPRALLRALHHRAGCLPLRRFLAGARRLRRCLEGVRCDDFTGSSRARDAAASQAAEQVGGGPVGDSACVRAFLAWRGAARVVEFVAAVGPMPPRWQLRGCDRERAEGKRGVCSVPADQ